MDDGEDDEQLYISTSEQSLFVSAVPYTVRDELPVLDQVDHMRNTCKLLMDAELFRHEDLDWVRKRSIFHKSSLQLSICKGYPSGVVPRGRCVQMTRHIVY